MAGKIRRHTGKNRTPWYTIYFNRKDVPLGTDYRAAVKRAGELLDGQAPGRDGPPVTIGGLCAAWIEAGHPAWKVAHFIRCCGAVSISELTDLQEYADYLAGLPGKRGGKFTPASIRDYLRFAREAAEWASKQGWPAVIPPMPDRLPKRVRAPKDIDPIRLREALTKIKHAGPIIRFIVASGCRPSEACNLTWEDISLRSGTALVSEHKTKHHGKTRTLYFTPAALAVLGEVKTKEGPVFLSRRNQPYTPSGLRAILDRHGIPGAYCLRHTAAQSWLDEGIDFGVVAGLLGHSDLRTVQVYAQVRDPKLVAAAKKIRGLLD